MAIRKMAPKSLLVLYAPAPVERNHDTTYPYRTSSDLLYLTGIAEDNFGIILASDGELHVFCQSRDPERERWQGPVLGPEKIAEHLGLDREFVHDFREFRQELTKKLQSCDTLYYPFGQDKNFDSWILGEIHKLRLQARKKISFPEQIIHSGKILHELRLIKDDLDLTYLRKAVAISSRAHNLLMAYTRRFPQGISEAEMKAFLEREFRRQGAEALAYPSIVAAGQNATILHYEKMSGFAQSHDLVLVDAGAEYRGYASDITRTFPAGGKFSPLQKEIYSLVLEAQKAAISAVKPGISLEDIHQIAVHVLCEGLWKFGLLRKIPQFGKNTIIWHFPTSLDEVKEKEFYKLFYMHRTSHFLGLDVHDVGRYYQDEKPRPLEKGMVFTIEPGLYFPIEYDFIPEEFRGIGIRIEDDILVTEDGCEILTKDCRKEWQDIENLK